MLWVSRLRVTFARRRLGITTAAVVVIAGTIAYGVWLLRAPDASSPDWVWALAVLAGIVAILLFVVAALTPNARRRVPGRRGSRIGRDPRHPGVWVWTVCRQRQEFGRRTFRDASRSPNLGSAAGDIAEGGRLSRASFRGPPRARPVPDGRLHVGGCICVRQRRRRKGGIPHRRIHWDKPSSHDRSTTTGCP